MNKIRTLNIEESPLLIFGGCYSNLQATQAMRSWAEKNDFLPEQCICTGDIIAYCGNPYETVELIRDWGVNCIQGNVEQSLADKADDCGCGFEEGSTCDTLSRGWYPTADAKISQGQREWFRQLPEQLELSIGGKLIQVVHGAASDINRFMFGSQEDGDFLNEFALLNVAKETDSNFHSEVDVVIAGHSGLPFTKHIDSKQ